MKTHFLVKLIGVMVLSVFIFGGCDQIDQIAQTLAESFDGFSLNEKVVADDSTSLLNAMEDSTIVSNPDSFETTRQKIVPLKIGDKTVKAKVKKISNTGEAETRLEIEFPEDGDVSGKAEVKVDDEGNWEINSKDAKGLAFKALDANDNEETKYVKYTGAKVDKTGKSVEGDITIEDKNVDTEKIKALKKLNYVSEKLSEIIYKIDGSLNKDDLTITEDMESTYSDADGTVTPPDDELYNKYLEIRKKYDSKPKPGDNNRKFKEEMKKTLNIKTNKPKTDTHGKSYEIKSLVIINTDTYETKFDEDGYESEINYLWSNEISMDLTYDDIHVIFNKVKLISKDDDNSDGLDLHKNQWTGTITVDNVELKLQDMSLRILATLFKPALPPKDDSGKEMMSNEGILNDDMKIALRKLKGFISSIKTLVVDDLDFTTGNLQIQYNGSDTTIPAMVIDLAGIPVNPYQPNKNNSPVNRIIRLTLPEISILGQATNPILIIKTYEDTSFHILGMAIFDGGNNLSKTYVTNLGYMDDMEANSNEQASPDDNTTEIGGQFVKVDPNGKFFDGVIMIQDISTLSNPEDGVVFNSKYLNDLTDPTSTP